MALAAADVALGEPAVRHLGRVRYEPTWQAMRSFNRARGPATPDEIWLLEHEPVFTLGLAGRREHILDAGDIPVVHCDRGGQVTYHGPGQVMAYLMLDLRRRGLGAKALVRHIEQSVIDLVGAYRIDARRRPGMPGVYVGDEKVAAVGLRIANGCSYHGVALNVDVDLEPFRRIDACGYPGLVTTRLADLGVAEDARQVGQRLLESLQAWLMRT
jgi:lipoyl(octanoyl) transferase